MSDHIVVNVTRHPPVGRCIYCGSDGGARGLRDEHIVALSLGGNVVLPKSSCKDCEGITSYIEGVVSRSIFGAMRSYFKVQKRKRPIEQTVTMEFETAVGKEIRQVKISDALPLYSIEYFDPPGLLVDELPAPIVAKYIHVWYSHECAEYIKRLTKPGDKKWSLTTGGNYVALARTIAKIAHASAVATFGIDSFKPLLTGVIRGTEPNIGYYIGTAEPPTKPLQLPAGTHNMPHRIQGGLMQHRETKRFYLTVNVCLFPFTGAPTYIAMVGEPTPALVERVSPAFVS